MEIVEDRVKKDRDGSVDLLRFVGIILMVMGHIGFGQMFDKYIHSFHMPLWYILSGYFLDVNSDIRKYFRKKTKTLLIPYAFWGILYEVIWSLNGGNQWLGMLFPNSIEIPINGALWFLPSMFFVDIIGFSILKYFSYRYAVLTIGILAVMGGLHIFKLPLSLDSALVGVGFLLIGFSVKHCHIGILLMKIKKSWAFFLLIGSSFLALVNGYVNVRTNTYAIVPLFWINASLIVIAFFNICKYIDKKTNYIIFQEIGSQSIIYVCSNQFVIRIVSKILRNFGVAITTGFMRIIMVVIVIAICFWTNRFLMKTPLRIILGK